MPLRHLQQAKLTANTLRRAPHKTLSKLRAIRQAHDNGATGITFFTAGSLKDKHLAILKKYNEAYNK